MCWQKVLCSIFYIVALAIVIYYCFRYSNPVCKETDHSYLFLCKPARIFLIVLSLISLGVLVLAYLNMGTWYGISAMYCLSMVFFSLLFVEVHTNCDKDGFYYQNLFMEETWVSFDGMTVEKHKGMFRPKKLFPPPVIDRGKQHYETMLETIYQRQQLK